MKALTVFFGGLTLVLGLAVITPQATINAVSASEFQAGRIIDDDIFYDKTAMGSAQAVQNFINSHTPACDTWGTQPSGYGGTRAQYAASQGWHSPPYVCLQNYHENPSNGETSFEKGGGSFSGGQSSGQIIWDAAQRHGINPQVLLVMLKKESAGPLFSDSWPLKNQYKYAMGYGCPDSGPGYSANCESSKAGFYKQMDFAAWQLRRYATYITEYNYQPNRWNYILHNPNPACGGQNVYIENVATASLYIYTPYVPTSAALNAYPGSTNCGAYGNRNFFMFFNEWFGSTTKRAQLVRTTSNNALYLIVDSKKHRVPSESIMKQLLPISGVDFVTQSYLDSKATDIPIKRLVRNSANGSIYLIDGGYKIKFGSCALVADYGYDCSEAVNLTEPQLASFITADTNLTNTIDTISGKKFYVQAGERKEIFDAASAQMSGLSSQSLRLSDASVEDLPYGAPVVRDDVVIRDRSNLNRFLRSNGTLHKLGTDSITNLSSYPATDTADLDSSSIARLGSHTVLEGLITDGQGDYILSENGKVRTTLNPELRGQSTLLSAASVSKIPGTAVADSLIVKSLDKPSLFYVKGDRKLALLSWSDVFSADYDAVIHTVPAGALSKIQSGGIYVRPGDLVKSDDSNTLYMTLGDNKIQVLPSFDPAVDIGHSYPIRTLTKAHFDTLEKVAGTLRSKISCAADKYIGVGAGIVQVPANTAGEFSAFVTNEFCAGLRVLAGPTFIKVKDSVAIYYVNGSQRQRLMSYAKYAELGGSSSNTHIVTQTGLNEFTQGPNL